MAVTASSGTKASTSGRGFRQGFGVQTLRPWLILVRWQRLSVIAAATNYVLALLICLRWIVHPIWGYMGFGWTPPDSPWIWGISLFLGVLPALYLPLTFRRPSGFVLWMMYLMVLAPAQIIPVFSDGRTGDYVPFQLALSFCFMTLCVIAELPLVRIRRPTMSPALFWWSIAAYSAFTYVLAIRTYGFPSTIPGLGDVYSLRDEFREQAAGTSALLFYLMGWQSKVINPLVLGQGLATRNMPVIALGGFGQIFLYATAGHKSVLFSGLLVIAILAGGIWGGKYLGSLASWGAAGLVVVSSLVALLLDIPTLVTLFVRRLLMVPGLLTSYYHDFFSENPSTMEMDPLSRLIFDTPYQEAVPHLIGRVYFDSSGMSANANLWADGYAALGIAGLVIVTLILGAILWTFNALAIGRNWAVASILAAVPIFSTANSALFTSIGSHGIGLALVLLWLLPDQGPRKEKRRGGKDIP